MKKNSLQIKSVGLWKAHSIGIAALILLSLATAPVALAQSYTLTTLASFNGANGANPHAGLTLSGSTLYGTTEKGGASGKGTVFSVPITGGTPTVLATFNGTNGSSPFAGLSLSGSTLYGTTYLGGANRHGTVFSIQMILSHAKLGRFSRVI